MDSFEMIGKGLNLMDKLGRRTVSGFFYVGAVALAIVGITADPDEGMAEYIEEISGIFFS
jgi:hypothetical protein